MSDEPTGHRKRPNRARNRVGALSPRPRVATQTATGGIGPISPETFAELFRQSPQPFAVGLLGGGLLAFNQAFCDLIGYSEAETSSLDRSKDLTPPEWREPEAAMLEQLIRTGQPVRYEKEYIRKDGSRVPVELLVQLIVNEEGAPACYFTSFQDLTERKRAEEGIRSLARFPAENPNPVLRLSQDGTVLYANEAIEALLREWDTAADDRAPPVLRALAEEALAKQSSIAVDVEQGERVWSFFVAPVVDSGYANFYGRDVTDRRRAEEALRFQAHLLESVQDAVVATDAQDRIIYWNRSAEELFGWTADEALGRPRLEVAATSQRDGENVWAHVQTGKAWSGEHEHRRRDATPFPASCTVSPILGEDGGVIGAVTVTSDITERKRAEEALRESEERYRTLLETAPDAILVHREGNLLYANPAAIELYGAASFAELAAHNIMELARAADAKKLKDRVRTIMAGQNVPPRETAVIRLDGREVPVEVISSSIDYGGGRAAQAVIRDITERRRAEEALRESEERLRLAQSGAKVGVWDWHMDKGVLSLTPELNEIYGLPPGTIKTYEDWRRLAHPDDIEGVEAERDRAIAGHEPFDLEFRILHASGEIRWISAKGSAAYDDSGRPVRVLGVNVDVTERKRAENALRDSEEKFKLIATHTPDHILVQDKDLRYTWVLNPQLGLTSDDMIGKTDFEFLPKEDAANLTTIKRRVLETGSPEYVTAPIASREGGTEYFEGSYVPTHDADGQVSGLIGYFRNVTERVKAEEELRLQATALQAAANGIVITDREGTIQWVNDAFTRLTGYGAAEATGNNTRVLKSGLHDSAFYRALWDTILSGRVWQGELVNKRKDGRLYTEEMTITPVVTSGGEITNFIAIKQDVTERKRAEEALRKANERIEKLLGANVIGIAEFDATKIVSANRALLDMTGYSERDVARGKIDWREITPPEYAERDNRAWREMMEHGECLPYEKEYITRDGKRIPILIAGVRLTEDPVTGVFLNLDITDWKLMERELAETTHYAEHLFESSLIGLTRFNERGLVDANDAFLDMVGHTREDLGAGLINVRAMTPAEYAALDERAMKEMMATEEAAPYEKEYIRKDGSRVPVLIGRKLIRQTPLEWVAFVLDLTERKRIEADLDRVRTEFLGEVSHELKTPLTAIKGCASMALSARTPPDPVETRELFEVVDAQANRLTDLVGNLLDMTRIEAGRMSIEPEEVEVAKMIDEARVVFEHSRYPHSLQVELPAKLPMVKADGRRIVQVLTNLFSNAAKFSSADDPIVISAERSGNEVIVSVRDRGAGIPADKIPLLFQKFVQVHIMGTKGTGLGLFICKGIVEGQGGRIWAESPGEGQGSTFSFALPAVPGTARAAGTKTGATGKRRVGAVVRGQGRVVAIDDEPHILHYVEHCLKTAGYYIASTTDPFAAAALVKSQKPDIVLLDMRLPGTSGLEVLEEIRKSSSVPVTFITATANLKDVARGERFGDTTWLEKPFSREELLGHVHDVLALGRKRQR